MTNVNLIPTIGYVAWFCGADDYDVFALPVVGLSPNTYFLDDGEVTDWEPTVLDSHGRPTTLDDLDTALSGYWVGGWLIGVTPAHMDCSEALEHLARFRVPLNPHHPDLAVQDEQGIPIRRAQMQARSEYVWPTLYQPA